jgi:diaminohydroxyphosphoribosylaminopyrimidine deaminase/5-amino-6-(5-phosphoribosylamino)uracil reductase
MMKAGLSLDGKITIHSGKGETITGSESQRHVHQIRNQVDAILIGVDTGIIDDPSLTTRLDDAVDTRDPLRIVLDSNLRLPVNARMLTQDSDAETWVICREGAAREKEAQLVACGAKVWRITTNAEGQVDLSAMLTFLGEKNITSVLVEGGARVHGAFYRQHLVDEMLLLYAPFIVGDEGTTLVRGYSLKSREDAPIFTNVSLQYLGKDIFLKALIQR